VYALAPASAPIRDSRYSRWIPLPANGDPQQAWREWLLGQTATALHGAVLMPCGDDGVELTARHRAQLAARFRLIEGKDEILLAMLDKASTYAWASRVGVPAPAARSVRSLAEALAAAEQLDYPFVLKPRHSHLFQRVFTTRVFVIHNREQLRTVFQQVEPHGLEMLVTELIPGDHQFCSYYTYLNERLEPLFHFTKQKLRQSPNGFGLGTYHISDWNPEVAELGLQFLRGVGLSGFGNVEFKRDRRDHRLKLIECNPRFTVPHEMLQICGIDVSLLVYNRLTGRPLPKVGEYRRGVRVLLPLDDLHAFREAHSRGELSWTDWLRSLLHRQHFLYFRWSDPWPATISVWSYLLQQVRRRGWTLLTRCRSILLRGVRHDYHRA
jgi:predicted ATP-grasp superfamily ATP-dependent carboligase